MNALTGQVPFRCGGSYAHVAVHDSVAGVQRIGIKDRVKVAKVRSNFLYDEMSEDNHV